MLEAGGKYISKAITIQRYPLYKTTIPFLHHIEGQGHNVFGEVFDVENVSVLDRLEGHPSWYRRLPITVEEYDGKTDHEVEAYFLAETINADPSIITYLNKAYNHEPIEKYTWGGK